MTHKADAAEPLPPQKTGRAYYLNTAHQEGRGFPFLRTRLHTRLKSHVLHGETYRSSIGFGFGIGIGIDTSKIFWQQQPGRRQHIHSCESEFTRSPRGCSQPALLRRCQPRHCQRVELGSALRTPTPPSSSAIQFASVQLESARSAWVSMGRAEVDCWRAARGQDFAAQEQGPASAGAGAAAAVDGSSGRWQQGRRQRQTGRLLQFVAAMVGFCSFQGHQV